MKTIEATVLVTDDRQLAVQLPLDIAPGMHRIVLLIDEPKPSVDYDLIAPTPMRREGDLLVYDGECSCSIEGLIDELRDERIRHFFPESAP